MQLAGSDTHAFNNSGDFTVDICHLRVDWSA
jgi:hypothetical protein